MSESEPDEVEAMQDRARRYARSCMRELLTRLDLREDLRRPMDQVMDDDELVEITDLCDAELEP